MQLPKSRPTFVYKYGSAARVAQIIRDLTFFFAPAAGQNDLYEFRARSLFTEDEDTPFRVTAKGLVAEGSVRNFDEAFQMVKMLDAQDVRASAEFVMRQVNDELARAKAHSGLTCFSTHSNNQRMWGTYGDNHAGALVQFSADKTRSQFASHLSPVIYTATKLPFCPSHLVNEQLEVDPLMMAAAFCVKSIDWRDEHEWRLLLLADTEQSTEARIVAFERKAIARVILGPRISPENERTIREAAARHAPEIPVLKRRIHPELAYEELVGFEQIHDFEQFRYWFDRLSAARPPRDSDPAS
ncbi:DUF2971 domain-containing protein [Bradyrhizobium sp. Pear77]|uniref:DUF2971 domain-containing protein n=1 Tax=Bradyrhizobium altum TaxID=1571202 RepID=UPI001E2C0765|nr:DUF2971 domain-containing protein [Bradyrhizobium altum]MCC8957079.1 DUF2971 domain-containing protein [Bradyrhizobium altum]